MKELKTYKLFLDDVRDLDEAYSYTRFQKFKDDGWIIVRNYIQFTTMIEKNFYTKNAFPEIISFDHDLDISHYAPKEFWNDKYNDWAKSQNFKEKTGFDCAEWLVYFCIKNNLELPEYYCHSMNLAGKENILILLDRF